MTENEGYLSVQLNYFVSYVNFFPKYSLRSESNHCIESI